MDLTLIRVAMNKCNLLQQRFLVSRTDGSDQSWYHNEASDVVRRERAFNVTRGWRLRVGLADDGFPLHIVFLYVVLQNHIIIIDHNRLIKNYYKLFQITIIIFELIMLISNIKPILKRLSSFKDITCLDI